MPENCSANGMKGGMTTLILIISDQINSSQNYIQGVMFSFTGACCSLGIHVNLFR